ncbi:DUF6106 family protein [Clostridium sp. Marseille-P299]|uniref:DUF6106 family protein n=1 Tax=Clostridium sp. Marseille-P299 TaxID=1805477 RepID=UPI000832EE4B|nr:DUF6106 family protein [Clostridium sp. Marseille-P299]
MNESYAEASVRRRTTMSDRLIKAAIIALIVFFVIFGVLLIGQFAILVATVLIVVAVFLFPRFNVEYEYVFCDGQLDFDKIMGNAKRKNALRIDFEKVEMMAPVNSHALDAYTHQQLKVKDFTSLNPEANVYAIIARSENEVLKILFEPSEKMLACIKQKAPRKLSEY